jgi:hypothetical protein
MSHEQYLGEEQMRQHLRQAYSQKGKANLLWQLARKIEDPVTPQNERGKRRFHRLLLTLAALIMIVLSTFVYFGLLRR